MNEPDPFFEPETEIESHNEFREAAREELSKFRNSGLRMIFNYKGNQTLALFCYAHAIGEFEMTGCKTAVEIARLLFKNEKKKAAVTECIKKFQNMLEIDRDVLAQRSADGRKKMAEVRIGKLKTKKEKR